MGFTLRRNVEFMRKQFIVLVVGLAFIFPTIASLLLADDDEIHWLDNYRDTIQEAKRTRKPIFLEFRCEP